MIDDFSLDDIQDLLTRDPSTLRERLTSARENEFIRLAADILENTKNLDDVRKIVDLEELARQFPKIKNHMSHGKVEGSHRDHWKQVLTEFQTEEEPTRPSAGEQTSRPEKTQEASRTKGPPVGQSMRSEAGKTLGEMRRSMDVSRTEIQKQLDIGLNELDEIERGESAPSLDLILQYASVLDVRPRLEFREDDVSRKELRRQAERLIDEVLEEMEIQEPLRKYCRAILVHMLEHGLYQKQYRSLEMVLEHIQELSKDFSIDTDENSPAALLGGGLNELLLDGLSRLNLTDMAFEEKVRVVAHKALEKVHDTQNS